MVGMASTGSITDCYNVATVTGGHPRYDKSGVGGIAGLFNECTITNSYNYGTVSRNKDSVDCAMGGAIGFDRKSSTSTLEEVAAKAENSGSIRFCYGISADQYGSAAGKRLVSGGTSVTLTACAHTGTCTETGLTAIDWSQSVSDIDKQHYEKYGLKQEEMDYIESTIKPME